MNAGRETAPVVVVGAGCIGAAIAYHLGKRGVKGVVVLEKEKFAGTGSTSKAAGGIRQQFSSRENVQLCMMSVKQFERFPEEMGTGEVFWQVGYLFLLSDPAQWATFQQQAEFQRGLGLDVRTLTPADASAIVPEVNMEGVLGGTFCPTDGLGDPHMVTQAYEARARELGAKFLFERPATGLLMEGDKVVGVRTSQGDIHAPLVVNAAGPYAAEIARWAGVDLPVLPYRRHCFITQPLPWVHEKLPMIVDMQSGVYMHRESGGMLLGLADKNEPSGFDTSVNWDFLEQVVGPAMERVPGLETAEIKTGWAGLYETTPDHNAVLGPVQGLSGLLLANGFSGHGFMQAPGVGQLIAEWVVDGKPSLDLSGLAFERFRDGRVALEANVI
ncbi:MAG: FAD-binding oxidoreductase [Candidatus Eisenbacteria bacterium]